MGYTLSINILSLKRRKQFEYFVYVKARELFEVAELPGTLCILRIVITKPKILHLYNRNVRIYHFL